MVLGILRRSKNKTQQELANKVGITRQMISAIENGAMPSVDTAKKIAHELDFDWQLLFPDEPKS